MARLRAASGALEWRLLRIGLSTASVDIFLSFSSDYTEKVWGIPCATKLGRIGLQRIKGLSLSHALLNALFKANADNYQNTGRSVHLSAARRGAAYEIMASDRTSRRSEVMNRRFGQADSPRGYRVVRCRGRRALQAYEVDGRLSSSLARLSPTSLT